MLRHAGGLVWCMTVPNEPLYCIDASCWCRLAQSPTPDDIQKAAGSGRPLFLHLGDFCSEISAGSGLSVAAGLADIGRS